MLAQTCYAAELQACHVLYASPVHIWHDPVALQFRVHVSTYCTTKTTRLQLQSWSALQVEKSEDEEAYCLLEKEVVEAEKKLIACNIAEVAIAAVRCAACGLEALASDWAVHCSIHPLLLSRTRSPGNMSAYKHGVGAVLSQASLLLAVGDEAQVEEAAERGG